MSIKECGYHFKFNVISVDNRSIEGYYKSLDQLYENAPASEINAKENMDDVEIVIGLEIWCRRCHLTKNLEYKGRGREIVRYRLARIVQLYL